MNPQRCTPNQPGRRNDHMGLQLVFLPACASENYLPKAQAAAACPNPQASLNQKEPLSSASPIHDRMGFPTTLATAIRGSALIEFGPL